MMTFMKLAATRYKDIGYGTRHLENDISLKYRAGVLVKGMPGEDGLYASFFALKQKSFPARHGTHTAW